MLTRKEKAEYRRKMILIIGMRQVRDLSERELAEVCQIGKLIGSDSMDDSKPIQKLDFQTFTWEKFEELKKAGYSVKAVINALGINKYQWMNWRKKHKPENQQHDGR